MMAKIFKLVLGKTIEKTIEKYIDDILVKSQRKENHTQHLKEAFALMRKHRLKLNLEKCAFGFRIWNFLLHLVTRRGIEVCPIQATTLVNASAPKTKKEIQALAAKLAALNKFIRGRQIGCVRYSTPLKGENMPSGTLNANKPWSG